MKLLPRGILSKRPPTREELRALVIKMAGDNRVWGYTRIQEALTNLGHEIGRGTIADILKMAGMEPAPERERKTTWAEFLRKAPSRLGQQDHRAGLRIERVR